MGWLLSCLIFLGLLTAIFILAERSRSRARGKLDKGLSVRKRLKRIIREDAERDYWWH